MQNLHLSTLNLCSLLLWKPTIQAYVSYSLPPERTNQDTWWIKWWWLSSLPRVVFGHFRRPLLRWCVSLARALPERFSNMDMKLKPIILLSALKWCNCHQQMLLCQVSDPNRLAVGRDGIFQTNLFSQCSNKGKLEVMYATNVPRLRKTRHVSLCSHVDPCKDETFLACRSLIGPQWRFKGILQIALSKTQPVFLFFLTQGSINHMDCFHLCLFDFSC